MSSLVTPISEQAIYDAALIDTLAFVHIVTLAVLMVMNLAAANSSRPYGPILARLSSAAVFPLLLTFAFILYVRLSKFF